YGCQFRPNQNIVRSRGSAGRIRDPANELIRGLAPRLGRQRKPWEQLLRNPAPRLSAGRILQDRYSTVDFESSPCVACGEIGLVVGRREESRLSWNDRNAIKSLVAETAISVESLTKSFPPARSGWRTFFQPFERPTAVALSGVSLEVREGEALALLGA